MTFPRIRWGNATHVLHAAAGRLDVVLVSLTIQALGCRSLSCRFIGHFLHIYEHLG